MSQGKESQRKSRTDNSNGTSESNGELQSTSELGESIHGTEVINFEEDSTSSSGVNVAFQSLSMSSLRSLPSLPPSE